jgi:hypothetical protein
VEGYLESKLEYYETLKKIRKEKRTLNYNLRSYTKDNIM